MSEPLKVISYGGGVQSTAMIVLATQGLIPGVTDALFSNVGDDSEYPATLTFVRDIMTPWAAERGIPGGGTYDVEDLELSHQNLDVTYIVCLNIELLLKFLS